MTWEHLGYAGLCVVVPAAWGLAVYRCSSLIERYVFRKEPSTDGATDETTLPLDYHI